MERRLAAILAADVVGYSRLMEADEAGTLEVLKAHRAEFIDPEIASHGGRIVKLMGDGALVEFGSVVDAVECAVAVQQGMAKRNADVSGDKRINFRIGVNLGDIIIEGDDIYGDGVNIAARLETLAEPGGICVSGTVHEHIDGKHGHAFTDDGEQTVKNMSRPVRVWRWFEGVFDVTPVPGAGAALPLPDKPSIAVLAFDNMSGDPEQEYFADGLAEDIITELSCEPELFVIARNSSFAYKGKSTDIARIGRELGVGYVLEGSIRRGGNRIRLTVQLIDTKTNHHVWAQRYDREFEDVFSVQDELTGAILNNLLHEFRDIEHTRALQKAPKNLDAYDYVLRAWAFFNIYDRENIEKARIEAEAALKLDPDYARALVILAWYHIYSYDWLLENLNRPLACAHELAQRAITVSTRDFWGYATRGYTELLQRRHDRALSSLERAVGLSPNSADCRALYASVLSFCGQTQKAADELDQALRLNPHYPNWYPSISGQVLYKAGRHQEAITLLEDLLNQGADLTEPHLLLAANYAAAGQSVKASTLIEDLLESQPEMNLSHAVRDAAYRDHKDLDDYLDRLRSAGLPE